MLRIVDEPVRGTDIAATTEPIHVTPALVVASSFRPTLPLVVAQANGALGHVGLTVRVLTASSSDAQLAQLMSGQVDIAHTALDNVVAWSAVAPVRVIGLTDLGVAHELVARDPIATVEQLRGHVIGVDSPQNGFVVLLDAALRNAGLDRGACSLKAVGGLGQRVDALMAGEVDACLLAGGDLARAHGAGFHSLLAIRDHFPRYPALALVARRPLEGGRRRTLTRYVEALVEATNASVVDPVAVAGVLGTDPAGAAAWLGIERARMTGTVTDAAAAHRTIADALAATGRIRHGDSIAPFTELLMDDVP